MNKVLCSRKTRQLDCLCYNEFCMAVCLFHEPLEVLGVDYSAKQHDVLRLALKRAYPTVSADRMSSKRRQSAPEQMSTQNIYDSQL